MVETSRRNCVFCLTPNTSELFTTVSQFGDPFEIRFCSLCHTHSLCPHPTDAQLGQAYAQQYYGVGDEKFPGWIERCIDAFRKARAAKVARKAPEGGRVLEIGCGNGRFLSMLAELGYECYGIEPPGGSAERAKKIKGVHLKEGVLEPEDFAAESLDLVALWHVYEHLPNPKEHLQMLSKMIKPGGYLLLSLPNIHSWQARWFRGRWFHLDPPRHLFFQTPSVLIQHFSQFGFHLKSITTLSLEQNVFGFQQSFLNLFLKDREVLYELLKGNPQYMSRYSGYAGLWQKIYFFCSAPLAVVLTLLEAAFGNGGTMELAFIRQESRGT